MNSSNTAPATPSIDQTVSVDKGSSGTSVTTPSFSTNAPNEVLLAFVASDATTKSMTVSGITGGGLTWVFVGRTNKQMGTSEVWRAYSVAQLSNVTVTASFSQSTPACSMTVVSFTGVDTSGSNGSGAIGVVASASSAAGVASVNITTSRANSWIFGVGNDYTAAKARTLGTGQSLVHQDLSPTGDTYWVQRMNVPTPGPGHACDTERHGSDGNEFNFTAVEILLGSAVGRQLRRL